MRKIISLLLICIMAVEILSFNIFAQGKMTDVIKENQDYTYFPDNYIEADEIIPNPDYIPDRNKVQVANSTRLADGVYR